MNKTQNSQNINRNDLKTLLLNFKGNGMISMISDTPVKMNQFLDYWVINEEGKKKKNPNPTPNPYFESGIRKVSRKYQINIGFNDYEKLVNDRREKEGLERDFEQEDNWFEVLSPSLVTDKKTHSKFYLRYQRTDKSTLETEYNFEGNEIEKQLFESFISKSGSDYSNQGVENTLKFEVCELENLKEVVWNGTKYILVD
jgi:uncharacterized protein (DUF2164 family)